MELLEVGVIIYAKNRGIWTRGILRVGVDNKAVLLIVKETGNEIGRDV